MLPISYELWPNGNNGSVTHSPDPPISHPMPLRDPIVAAPCSVAQQGSAGFLAFWIPGALDS